MAVILVVDDDRLNSGLLVDILRVENHEVLVAYNGAEGLEHVQQYRPELILLDMRLPVLSGWEVAARLKADPDFAHIPIIAVSAQASRDDEQKALVAGCDGYIAKPFTIRKLRDCISRFAVA